MRLTAEKLFKEFCENMQEIGLGDYKSSKKLTEKVLGYNGVIANILENNGLEISKEYFRIDVSGWINRWTEIAERAKSLKVKPHLWDLQVAVEHENDKTDWLDELVKLAHIRCPLKIVIGYNHCDRRNVTDGVGNDVEKLQFAAEVLQKTVAFDKDGKETYCIILGNAKGVKKSSYADFDYRGYVFDYTTRQFRSI
jgi:hypothetical protein